MSDRDSGTTDESRVATGGVGSVGKNGGRVGATVVNGVDVDSGEVLGGRVLVDDGDDVDVAFDEEGFESAAVTVDCSLRSRFTVAAAAAPREPPTSATIKIAPTTTPMMIFPTLVLQKGTTGNEGKGLVPASSASTAEESVTAGVMPVEALA